MPERSPADTIVCLGGLDIGSSLESIEGPNVGSVMAPRSSIVDTWRRVLPVGVRTLELGGSGWFNDDELNYLRRLDDALSGPQTPATPASDLSAAVGLRGLAPGSPVTLATGAFAGGVTIGPKQEGLTMASFALEISGDVRLPPSNQTDLLRGPIVLGRSSITDMPGTTQDEPLGPIPAALGTPPQVLWVVHCGAEPDATTFTLVENADPSVPADWATVATLTISGVGVGIMRFARSEISEDYLAVQYTGHGGTPDQDRTLRSFIVLG